MCSWTMESLFLLFCTFIHHRCEEDIQSTFWFLNSLLGFCFDGLEFLVLHYILSCFSNSCWELLLRFSFILLIFSLIYYTLLNIYSYIETFVFPYLEILSWFIFIWSLFLKHFFMHGITGIILYLGLKCFYLVQNFGIWISLKPLCRF